MTSAPPLYWPGPLVDLPLLNFTSAALSASVSAILFSYKMLKKADSGTTPSLSITDKLGQMGKLGTYSGLVEAVTSLFAA